MTTQLSGSPAGILSIAQKIFGETYLLSQWLKVNSIAEPSLSVGASTELWTSKSKEIEQARSNIVGLTNRLTKLIHGPHDFLHEFISPNWDLGALYTVLEFDILEKIPLDGQAHVSTLSQQSGIPENKLLRILRLVSCENIIEEVSIGMFRHTAISEELVKDTKFRSFIGFQLFETRIGSTHLAESLKSKANDYQNGQSAFKHAHGSSLYDFHKTDADKGARFDRAMQSIAQGYDPGNALFAQWFKRNETSSRNLVVNVGGGKSQVWPFLAEQFPGLSIEVRDASQELLSQRQQALPPALEERVTFKQHELYASQPLEDAAKVFAYVMWNVCWNLDDANCLKLLQTFVPVIEESPQTVLLINEGMSPPKGMFEQHIDHAYRRRDVTAMTMHNTKLRTEEEWRSLFNQASPYFKVDLETAHTGHAYKGLWEVRWTQGGFTNGH